MLTKSLELELIKTKLLTLASLALLDIAVMSSTNY